MNQKITIRVEDVPLNSLTIRTTNPRTHSKEQIDLLKRSITEFGFTTPLLVDDENQVIAGAGRLMAARELGLEVVPIIRLSHLTAEQVRALVIADNQIAARAGWDLDLLRVELSELEVAEFDLELLGFETAILDQYLAVDHGGGRDEAGEGGNVAPPVSRPGDVWVIGPHRLGIGDIREPDLLARVLGGRSVRMVLTDPPYNVRIKGHVRPNKANGHDEFAFASGEMSEEEFITFLVETLTPQLGALVDGGLAYSFIDWRHAFELNRAAFRLSLTPINLAVWVKSNGGMGSLYRSRHELCAIYKKGGGKHVNNVELGRHGRNRTNIWQYSGVNAFGEGREEALADHPTVKPVDMLADAILDVTKRKDLVLDGFAGSGSTIVAAARTGRVGVGVEYEPKYADVALRRLRAETGEIPRLLETNENFDAIAERRVTEARDDG
ncbi:MULTISPECIES: site-specific DNA-methyltransferase [Hyphobacterium]|uniref:Methyltransferase n=1 Tax=Hyphobacterium vulgare TaxID=1736751 RepID=A0ABV6ZW22_9PROT